MVWREPRSTNPAEHICSPTSLPALQGSLGTSSPMHKMISDFSFPVLSFALQPMPSTTSSAFLSLSCCSPSSALLPSHPWFCQVHHLQPHFSLCFTSAGPSLLHFYPTKHASWKTENKYRNTWSKGYLNIPTAAWVPGLVCMPRCLLLFLCPLIPPSCHLCFMVNHWDEEQLLTPLSGVHILPWSSFGAHSFPLLLFLRITKKREREYGEKFYLATKCFPFITFSMIGR